MFHRALFICLMVITALATPLSAGWFGEDEEVEQAKHVAALLREPTRLIAQAQAAFDAGNLEGAIEGFTKAREAIVAIERQENTTGAAFASLRLKKFHCISMLDALALQQANMQDRRQAVTNTDELAARLAQERASVTAKREQEAKAKAPPAPPTDNTLLAEAEKALPALKEAAEAANNNLKQLAAEAKRAAEAFTEAAKANTAADANAFVAGNAVVQAQAQGAANSDAVIEARAAHDKAKQEAEAAQAALKAAREAQSAAELRRKAAEVAAKRAQAALAEGQGRIEMLRKAVAEQEAQARAKQQQELAAQELLRRQAEAEAAEKARRSAEVAARARRDAEAKAAAEKEAKECQDAIAWCNELWRLKRVESLEERLAESAGRWPERPEFIVLLAKLRLTQNRPDDALELAAMVPAKSACDAQAKLVAAGAYLTKNRPHEAMRILEEAIKAAPKEPAPYFNMAVTLLRLPEIDPNRDLAARYYTQSVELGGKRSSTIERRLEME